MTVRAVLLAGGLGSRLHPLTQTLPKPMVPVMGRPWLGRLVHRLDKYGFAAIVLGLYHRAEVVAGYFGDGSAYMTPVLLSKESVLLGTGGAIRFSAFPADDTVLVLNADIVQHFDLLGFLDFHRSQGASVTIGVVQVPDPSAYGAVEMAADETFPGLVVAGVPVYGYPLQGYWLDIGTRDRYLDLHADEP